MMQKKVRTILIAGSLATGLATAVPHAAPAQVQQNPESRLMAIYQEVDDLNQEHLAASRICDRARMAEVLARIESLVAESGRLARIARETGAYSQLNPAYAETIQTILLGYLGDARQRQPRNCGGEMADGDAQDVDAFGRFATRQVKAFRQMEELFAAMEDVRQRGSCDTTVRGIVSDTLRSADFRRLFRPEQIADWERRLAEFSELPCPPEAGSGAPATDPDVPAGPAARPVTDEDIRQFMGAPPSLSPAAADERWRQAARAYSEALAAGDARAAALWLAILREIVAQRQRIAEALKTAESQAQYEAAQAALRYAERRYRESSFAKPDGDAPTRGTHEPRDTSSPRNPPPESPPKTAPATSPTQGAFRLDRTAQRLLVAHNRTRAEAGVPPLAWDPQLAAQAAAYGPQLAQHRRPIHAPRKGRETSRENLLQSMPGTPVDRMVGVWIAERQHFVPGIFPNVSRTGNWADVGHYTQMVWPTTTNVGCAVHRGGQFDWLICRYSPPGNADGQPLLMPASSQAR